MLDASWRSGKMRTVKDPLTCNTKVINEHDNKVSGPGVEVWELDLGGTSMFGFV